MKVILLKELKGKGGEGDVIDVARGYANNYLLPQGYAVRATEGNLKQLEQRRSNIEKREEVRIARANELAEKLNDVSVHVVAQVGEGGQLFGSVTSMMIADAIKESYDVEIDRHYVDLKKPIKMVGTYPVPVTLYRDIKAVVQVVVDGKEASAEVIAEAAEAAEAAKIIEAATSGAEDEFVEAPEGEVDVETTVADIPVAETDSDGEVSTTDVETTDVETTVDTDVEATDVETTDDTDAAVAAETIADTPVDEILEEVEVTQDLPEEEIGEVTETEQGADE